jgi:hypothetical protein
MNQKLASSIQARLHAAETQRPTLGNYFALLAKHAATVDQGSVTEVRGSDNRVPSSASAQGMEARNQDYGQSAEDLDQAKGVEVSGAKETGQVHLALGKKTITSETEGVPNLSLGKSAALQFLRVDSLRRKLAVV